MTMHIGLTGGQREAIVGDHRELLGLFQEADRLGFDSLWLAEYHFRRTGLPYPSPLLLAAAVFARTERMRVGTGVTLVPIHHPLILAEQLAQLDVQGGGRLDVGIGRPNDATTLTALGIDPTTKHERFVQGYDLLLRAWQQGRVSSDGGPWRFPETEIGPAPIQQPHPPIYVAGMSYETIGFAIERRLPVLLSLERPEGLQLQRWRELDKTPEQTADLWTYSLNRYVFIGRTDAQAQARLDQALLSILRRCRWAPVDVDDADAVREARAKLIRHQAIVGDPEACVLEIERLAREVGTGHLRCVFNALGGLDVATTLAQMRLFAEEVLPACRGIGPPASPSISVPSAGTGPFGAQ
jgi:alkanesulfonate monooxygenase SsuD/methylene tetrahydromethanopterin reductase-like flavin-dependent oxidoreductase (luciferase family)